MKPVFKCDFCDFMGVESDVQKHEVECTENYTRRSCLTCRHRGYSGLNFTCYRDVELPAGKMREFCPKYEQEDVRKDPVEDFLELMLGGKK